MRLGFHPLACRMNRLCVSQRPIQDEDGALVRTTSKDHGSRLYRPREYPAPAACDRRGRQSLLVTDRAALGHMGVLGDAEKPVAPPSCAV